MTPELFFELFLKELGNRPDMFHYYKFLENHSKLNFRRNYFLERLRYVAQQVNNPDNSIWDCGCGYGTTCLFLAMNGIPSHGTTLEFYNEYIDKRYAYWNQFGDARLFSCSYENLFDQSPPPESYDHIIIQDTLHHLEPIDDALTIFHQSLKNQGQLVIIEENGNNLIQRAKLYKRRGNKRIIKIWDKKLQKEILLGNENIRSLDKWSKLLKSNGFDIPEASVQYVRYYLPFRYNEWNAESLLAKERALQKNSNLKKEYFFFGLNFIAEKRKL
jgi:SAM-dependent methyltransferase